LLLLLVLLIHQSEIKILKVALVTADENTIDPCYYQPVINSLTFQFKFWFTTIVPSNNRLPRLKAIFSKHQNLISRLQSTSGFGLRPFFVFVEHIINDFLFVFYISNRLRKGILFCLKHHYYPLTMDNHWK
jgi:hypothetical protein